METQNAPIMKHLLKTISYLGLALSILPSVFVFAGVIESQTHYNLSIAGMCLWFSSAIFWIKAD